MHCSYHPFFLSSTNMRIYYILFYSFSGQHHAAYSYLTRIIGLSFVFFFFFTHTAIISCTNRAMTQQRKHHHCLLICPPPRTYNIRLYNIFFSQSVFLRRMVMLGRGQGKCVFYISVIRPQPCGCREALLTRANICYAHTRISSHVFAWALKRGSQCSHYARYTYSILYLYVYTSIPTILI